MPPNSDPEMYEEPHVRTSVAMLEQLKPDLCSMSSFTPKKQYHESRAYFSDGMSATNFTPLKKHVSFPESHPFADVHSMSLRNSSFLMTPISPVDSRDRSLLSDVESEVLFSSLGGAQYDTGCGEHSRSDISYSELYSLVDEDIRKVAGPCSMVKMEEISFKSEATTEFLHNSFQYPHLLRDITEDYLRDTKQEYVYIDEEPDPFSRQFGSGNEHDGVNGIDQQLSPTLPHDNAAASLLYGNGGGNGSSMSLPNRCCNVARRGFR